MQNDKDSGSKKSLPHDGIPLLEDIVIPYNDLPYVDLDEEDIKHQPLPFDSEIAAIDEDEDDLALVNMANDDLALAEMVGDDSYDYDDEEAQDAVSSGFVVPQHDVVITAIRTALQQQLAKEMSCLIAPVLDQAIQQFSKQIRSELSDSLERRIAELIQQELNKQFKREKSSSGSD